MIPNVHIPGCWYWEADLIEISRSNYITEYEIKISHSDFLRDLKKKRHIFYRDNYGGGAVKFWYCCPEGIISVDETPGYAGLLYVDTDENIKVIKPAPRRKVKPITSEQKIELLEKGVDRYWHKLFKLNKRIGG
jgi:hypothetical protein